MINTFSKPRKIKTISQFIGWEITYQNNSRANAKLAHFLSFLVRIMLFKNIMVYSSKTQFLLGLMWILNEYRVKILISIKPTVPITISPTFVAATALIEKKPCFHIPHKQTRSLIVRSLGIQSKIEGRTDNSLPSKHSRIILMIQITWMVNLFACMP